MDPNRRADRAAALLAALLFFPLPATQSAAAPAASEVATLASDAGPVASEAGPIENAADPGASAAGPIERAAGPIERAAGPIESAAGPIESAAGPIESGAEADAGRADAIGSGAEDAQSGSELDESESAQLESAAPPPDAADPAGAGRPALWAPLREPAERGERIRAHTPAPIEPADDSIFPLQLRIRWLSRWAELRAAAADFEGARASWERAIALGGGDIASWRGLGRMRVQTGEPEAAEGAFLAALELAETSGAVDPSIEADINRELGELYLFMHWPEAAAVALDRALELAPGAIRANRLVTLALEQAGEIADEQTAGERIVLWPVPRSHHWRARIESGLNAVLDGVPGALRRTLIRGASTLGRVLAGIALIGLLAAFCALRLLRKAGDLVVGIDFPDELDGLFSVRLASRRGRHKRPGHGRGATEERQRSSRTRHYGVGRETQFSRLHAGRYYVTVTGTLRDPDTGETLTEPYEEQQVEVAGDQTTRLDLDLSPGECPVDVNVRWDKRPASEVGVVARGLPESLRYATTGHLRLRLPMGSHTIVMGSGDRIAECDVEVGSFRPTSLDVDLAGTEHMVFKGCPPAVEPYLHGDLSGAARALERDGHSNLAHLLLARLHQEQGYTERAAEQLESAGHMLEAAKLRESISDFQRAAALFEDSGNAKQAAETYRSAGDWEKAGQLFESIGELARAAECFREVGATDALVGVLERRGEFFEAAQVALEAGDRARSVRLLQEVPRGDPSYAEACGQLVDAFEREGHSDLAAHKLEEFIAAVGPAGASTDLYSRLADLFTRGEENGRALEVLEDLRQRDPTYPHVASRIETLRKRLSGQSLTGADARAAPTAFVSQHRYEILEEVGRGGMGLIFKARDRRLGRIVALKRLPENLRDHPKALELFLNEAQAAARLNHPNIVTVFDTDQDDGTFFITMELLEGQPLNAILAKRRQLGARDTAQIGGQVATGLQYAHERQVVHRDIKTANLFLTTDRVVKIMDFGLAKMMEEVRRGTTVIGGTPFYMAPEQAVGGAVDYRADIYALGITLFELVTGRVPFQDGDIAYHHRHTPPPDPRDLAKDVPDALAELILEMIRKQPDQRCGSAAEVGHRLEQIIAAG